jgi:hypothetical protein
LGYTRDRLRAAGEAGLVAAGMVAFALLSAAGAARGLAAAAGLVLAALALYLSMRTGTHPLRLFALVRPRGWAWAAVPFGFALGAGLAVLYRSAWMPTAVPSGLRSFVLVAMLIGAAEEVLYRGYVQGRLGLALQGHSAAGLRNRRAEPDSAPEARGGYGDPPRSSVWASVAPLVGAVLLAAGAHTAYKTALFVWPPAYMEVDYGFLVTWTLVGGVAFGALRAACGTVWPAVAAHVAFDLVAYGDAAEAPWWVWM